RFATVSSLFRLAPVLTMPTSALLNKNGSSFLAMPRSLSIDQVMVEERAGAFAKRSIKTSAKLSGLKMAISMMDLTTLEGKDTPGKVAFLCRKAMQPAHPRYGLPPCAAVCVYSNFVQVAKTFLGDSGL